MGEHPKGPERRLTDVTARYAQTPDSPTPVNPRLNRG